MPSDEVLDPDAPDGLELDAYRASASEQVAPGLHGPDRVVSGYHWPSGQTGQIMLKKSRDGSTITFLACVQ